jgi:hypothetical protein
MLRGGWEFQEGTAVGFLLVWCGRSATTLVAAGHKSNKQTPGFRLKSITGMTKYLARAGWNLAMLIQTKFEQKSWVPAHNHYRDDGIRNRIYRHDEIRNRIYRHDEIKSYFLTLSNAPQTALTP